MDARARPSAVRFGVVSVLRIVTLGIRDRHRPTAVGERLFPVAIRARMLADLMSQSCGGAGYGG